MIEAFTIVAFEGSPSSVRVSWKLRKILPEVVARPRKGDGIRRRDNFDKNKGTMRIVPTGARFRQHDGEKLAGTGRSR